MKIGKLDFEAVAEHRDLVAGAVWKASEEQKLGEKLFVSEIDPELADTAEFCEAYGVGLDISANCVVVKAKRADRTWYAACMVLATDWVDVNKKVKKHLDARKLSFAPMDEAVELSNMEYGGITPVGLPEDWQILVDESVAEAGDVIIGSGIRGSKIALDAKVLAELPNAEVIDIKKL